MPRNRLIGQLSLNPACERVVTAGAGWTCYRVHPEPVPRQQPYRNRPKMSWVRQQAPGRTAPRRLPRPLSHLADVVVSATIVTTQATNNTKPIEGEQRSEWIGEAHVDRIFKGFLGSQDIAFKYYGREDTNVDYFGPPYADFRSGNRYILFLRGQNPICLLSPSSN